MSETENYQNRRQHERYPLMLAGEACVWGGISPCVIFDVSEGGAKIRLKSGDKRPRVDQYGFIVLDVPFFGEFQGIVAWVDDDYLGIRFVGDHSEEVRSMVEQAGRAAA